MSDEAQARFETNSWASREEDPSLDMGTVCCTVRHRLSSIVPPFSQLKTMRRRLLAAGSISDDVHGLLSNFTHTSTVLVRLQASWHGERLTAWQITEHWLYTTVL